MKHLVYNEKWQMIALYDDTDTDPTEEVIHHGSGPGSQVAANNPDRTIDMTAFEKVLSGFMLALGVCSSLQYICCGATVPWQASLFVPAPLGAVGFSAPPADLQAILDDYLAVVLIYNIAGMFLGIALTVISLAMLASKNVAKLLLGWAICKASFVLSGLVLGLVVMSQYTQSTNQFDELAVVSYVGLLIGTVWYFVLPCVITGWFLFSRASRVTPSNTSPPNPIFAL